LEKWIPGSLAVLAPRNDERLTIHLQRGNEGFLRDVDLAEPSVGASSIE
jgi:hypothetical protein